MKWVLTGATNFDIEGAIRHHYPGTPLDSLLQAVAKSLAEGADTNPDIVRGWCFHAARDLYRRMVEIGDYAGALRAVQLIRSMAG